MAAVRADRLREVIYHLMRPSGATRPQLCAWTRLSPAAMQEAIDRLRALNALEEIGYDVSSGGRRAALYRLKPAFCHVIGVSVERDTLSVGLFDAGLEALTWAQAPFSLADSGPEACVQTFSHMARALTEDAHAARVMGAGVTLPGALDERGVVLRAYGLPVWQGFSLAARSGEALGLPAVADRNTYARLMYLSLRGVVRKSACAVLLCVRDDVSAALMAQGVLFRGGRGQAGEIGHTTVRRDGIPCACGNTGCLTLYSSEAGLVRQYNAQASESLKSAEEVLVRMEQGDATAGKIVMQALGYLVEAMASIVNTYDPLEILLDCRWLSTRKPLYFRMLDALHAKSLSTRAHQAEIHLLPPAAFGSGLAGACAPAAALAFARLGLAPDSALLD